MNIDGPVNNCMLVKYDGSFSSLVAVSYPFEPNHLSLIQNPQVIILN
jgi:hypothetical protein